VVGAADAGSQMRLALVDTSLSGTPRLEPLELTPQTFRHPRFSPDGTRVAFATDDGRDADVWVYDLKRRDAARKLTFEGRNRAPEWTPDSRHVSYQSDRDGTLSIWQQPADGGPAQQLYKENVGATLAPEAWTTDGKTLIFSEFRSGTVGQLLFALNVGSHDPPKRLIAGTSRGVDLSSDGRWIAYATIDRSRSLEHVVVQPFPPNDAPYQIDTDGGRDPLWAPDGKRLFYLQPNQNRIASVDVVTSPNFRFGRPTFAPIEGLVFGSSSDALGRNFDISPDGKQFIVVLAASTNSVDPAIRSRQDIAVAVNWFDELRRRAPGR